jgi:hypothetical protein
MIGDACCLYGSVAGLGNWISFFWATFGEIFNRAQSQVSCHAWGFVRSVFNAIDYFASDRPSAYSSFVHSDA